MAQMSSPLIPRPAGRLARRFDLLLWGLFGHGARLATRRPAWLTTLLAALGLALSR